MHVLSCEGPESPAPSSGALGYASPRSSPVCYSGRLWTRPCFAGTFLATHDVCHGYSQQSPVPRRRFELQPPHRSRGSTSPATHPDKSMGHSHSIQVWSTSKCLRGPRALSRRTPGPEPLSWLTWWWSVDDGWSSWPSREPSPWRARPWWRWPWPEPPSPGRPSWPGSRPEQRRPSFRRPWPSSR